MSYQIKYCDLVSDTYMIKTNKSPCNDGEPIFKTFSEAKKVLLTYFREERDELNEQIFDACLLKASDF